MNRKSFCVLFTVLFISLTIGCVYAEDQEEQNLVEAAHQMKSRGAIQLNFKDLEITKFIRFMSELLGENIIVDPSVNGKVSVVSPKAVSLKEARQIMLSILEMNNLAIQDMGGYSKVLPLSAGPSTSNNVIKGDMSIQPGEAVTTQVVPLKYIKAGYLLAPLKSALSTLQVTPLGEGGSIVLVGKASQLSRAVAIIRALDSKNSLRSIKLVPLVHADAKAMETSFNAMAKDLSSKLAGLIAVGDERTNSMVFIGSKQALMEAQRILKGLDVKSRANNFHVYKLQNADAKVVAEQLGKIMSTAARLSPDTKGAVPASVVPDLSTNSLVFTATQRQYDSITSVLKDLDIQPKQVLLRGLIAEVNLTKLNSAGVDWAAWGGDMFGSVVAAGNLQLGSTGVPSDIQELYQKLITKEEVYPNPVTPNTYTTTNTNGAGLAYAYIKLLNQYDAVNVLSMPRLLCTDNLESHLQVGQVIPQLKGSVADTTNPKAVQNNYEYKDVGLILNVTPHIRNGKLVSLEIEQRTEDVLTTQNSTTPVTSKREIKTNVLVANGDTVILGGLIKEAEKVLKNRVPLLSYIPLIGNLFKSNEKEREKVDLMVFLTPYILETPQHAAEITNDVINRKQAFSEAEKTQLKRNAEGYKKATKQEGITNEYINTTSGDQKIQTEEKKKTEE